jgi:hypothetical protein
MPGAQSAPFAASMVTKREEAVRRAIVADGDEPQDRACAFTWVGARGPLGVPFLVPSGTPAGPVSR